MASICSQCKTARAAVSCCGKRLCLLHATVSEHGAHEARWAVYNAALLKKTKPAVAAFKAAVAAQLKRELDAAGAAMEGQATGEALRGGQAPVPPVAAELAPAAVAPLMPLASSAPTFASMQRVLEEERKKQREQEELRVQRLEAAAKKRRLNVPAVPVEAPKLLKVVAPADLELLTAPVAAAPTPELSPAADTPAASTTTTGGDGDVVGKRRKRVLSLLYKALASQSNAMLQAGTPKAPDGSDELAQLGQAVLASGSVLSERALGNLCVQIEGSLFHHNGGSLDKYLPHAQSLIINLGQRDNTLHERVLSGELAPSALVALASVDLVSDAQAQHRAKVVKEAEANLEDFTLLDAGYVCPACGSKKTKAQFVAQVRDIGKSETWGSKDRLDDVRQKAVCMDCSHVWWRSH